MTFDQEIEAREEEIKRKTNGVRSRIRTISNQVKLQTLVIASNILENPDSVPPELYTETYLSILRNTIPKSQEITGEDGDPIQFNIIRYLDDDTDKPQKVSITLPISTESLPNPDTKSF